MYTTIVSEVGRSVQVGFHTCWTKIGMPQMYCWPLQIFSDEGGRAKYIFLAFWKWKSRECTHIMHNWSVRVLKAIPWCCRRRKLKEKAKAVWNWCLTYSSPVNDLFWTIQFHLELQSVVHIMLICCMIICDLPFVKTMIAAETWCHLASGQCDTSLPLWYSGSTETGKSLHIFMLSRSCFLGFLFVLTSRNHWGDAGLNPQTPLKLLSWSLYSI